MARNAPESLAQDELIREVCRGQTELFYQLISPFERTVFSVAYSVLNDVAEAEDVTQEAFLKALKGLPSFRGESKFRTWLIQITLLNEARLRFRRCRAHVHESLDEEQRERGWRLYPQRPRMVRKPDRPIRSELSMRGPLR
jgi:RNA polymerase sigma-70 factor (ECF subfamily)